MFTLAYIHAGHTISIWNFEDLQHKWLPFIPSKGDIINISDKSYAVILRIITHLDRHTEVRIVLE